MPQVQKLLAPVTVDGNVLFYVRGTTSYPADERARAISKRIIKVAADRTFNPDSLKGTRQDYKFGNIRRERIYHECI